MCHIVCLWDYNTLQSSVTGDVSDPAGDYSSLWPEQSDFFSSFSLPFLYSWRHRIILPILEWLQQRHCYSQGAVSPRCNSIHSQLDWPVIYRKSSPSEELSLHTHTHWEFSLSSSWCVRSQVRTVQGSEHQWEKDVQLKTTESLTIKAKLRFLLPDT